MKIVVVSDVHLGSDKCEKAAFNSFLKTLHEGDATDLVLLTVPVQRPTAHDALACRFKCLLPPHHLARVLFVRLRRLEPQLRRQLVGVQHLQPLGPDAVVIGDQDTH